MSWRTPKNFCGEVGDTCLFLPAGLFWYKITHIEDSYKELNTQSEKSRLSVLLKSAAIVEVDVYTIES